MRYTLLILIILVAVGCKKAGTPQTTPTSNNNTNNPSNPNNPNNPSTVTAWYIPNWLADDTLIAYEENSNHELTGVIDTIFTDANKDTSFIIYQGKRYYIWAEVGLTVDSFKADQSTYNNFVISPTTNKADAISTSELNSVSPHKYKDAQGNWKKQVQELTLNDWKHFKRVRLQNYVGSFKKI